MKQESLKALVECFGERYSEMLGIDLSGGDDREIFKWFLASLLFGAPITESSVFKTYGAFKRHGVLTPRKIIEAGWDRLVEILDEGSYTRYDFKTADKLLNVTGNLLSKYGGSLNQAHEQASDSRDLSIRLKMLGKGVGEVTVSIFLRELRGVWKKADPNPTELEILAARELGIVENEATPEKALKQLKDFWKRNEITGNSLVDFETALVRLGKRIRRKGKVAAFTFN